MQTIQQSFGLGCLEFTCDTADVKPMSAEIGTKNPVYGLPSRAFLEPPADLLD